MNVDPHQVLLEQTRRARDLGYRFELCRIEWQDGKKVQTVRPPKEWHTRAQVDDSYVQQRIREGCNAYLIHCKLSDVTLHDADSPEEVARVEALYPGRSADVVTRKGRHWYARGYVPGAFTKNWHMAFGPGSFYALPDGSVQVYEGALPDPATLPPAPAPHGGTPASNGSASRRVARSAWQREWTSAVPELAEYIRRWNANGWGGQAHAGLLAASTRLARLDSEHAEEAYLKAFAMAEVEPNAADLAKIESAVNKTVPDVVVPDEQMNPQERFWAGGMFTVDTEVPQVGYVPTNLPVGFWESRPVLRHIRQAAHTRACSADAVFGVVLALLASHVPGELRVDTGVRAPTPLSTFVALLGNSGGGKSSAAAVALDLFPHLMCRPEMWPLGSGEGLCDAYMERVETVGADAKKGAAYEQVRYNGFFHADEGGRVLDLKNRQGSTLLATLRDAWSGGTFGQRNTVDGGRSRRVERATIGVWVGLQQPHAARLLGDEVSAVDGTVQRFVWLQASDPAVPDEPDPWPGTLALALLGGPIALPTVHEITVSTAIRSELRRSQVARARGTLVAQPGREQDDALRVRLGALLALLDGRTHIDDEDWGLAGVVLDTSASAVRQVRGGMRGTALQRKVASAELDDAATDQLVEKMLIKVVEHVRQRLDGRALSHVRKSVARRRPEEFDAAVQLGVDRGLLRVDTDASRGDKIHAV